MDDARGAPGRRVLLVEDDYLIATSVEMLLSESGWTVLGPIGRLDEAIERCHQDDFDLAILDILIRGAPVFPLADLLAERAVPFLFLSGQWNEPLPVRFRDSTVLMKPCPPDRLLAMLDAIHIPTKPGNGQAMPDVED